MAVQRKPLTSWSAPTSTIANLPCVSKTQREFSAVGFWSFTWSIFRFDGFAIRLSDYIFEALFILTVAENPANQTEQFEHEVKHFKEIGSKHEALL